MHPGIRTFRSGACQLKPFLDKHFRYPIFRMREIRFRIVAPPVFRQQILSGLLGNEKLHFGLFHLCFENPGLCQGLLEHAGLNPGFHPHQILVLMGDLPQHLERDDIILGRRQNAGMQKRQIRCKNRRRHHLGKRIGHRLLKSFRNGRLPGLGRISLGNRLDTGRITWISAVFETAVPDPASRITASTAAQTHTCFRIPMITPFCEPHRLQLR